VSHATHTTHPRTYLIACGGTGGHLAPGIALAEALIARGHRATLLISSKKVDARLSEKYPNQKFVRLPSAPFSRNPLRLLVFLIRQFHGLLYSLNLIHKTKPDAIVGFGGFTTASIIIAGWLCRVPVALHEANRVPGRAIRTLAPLARRIFLPPGVTLRNANNPRVRPMGLPVRAEIHREPRDDARAAFGFATDRNVLVVLGGSQGASSLNTWTRANLPALAREGIQVCCVTGLDKTPSEKSEEKKTKSENQAAEQPISPSQPESDFHSLPFTLHSSGGSAAGSGIFTPFCDRMATLLSAADLVVSRAGAGTIAELIRCATPAILIPYPHAADNHQQANALYFEQQGGGIVIDQTRMDTLTREVRDIIFNDWLLRKFQENLKRMDRANSLDLLLADLEQITPPRNKNTA